MFALLTIIVSCNIIIIDNIIIFGGVGLSTYDLLLHPVRMGIVQNLIGDRKLTAQQMAEQLPHVPQATLYRHLNKLLEAGIIAVLEEKPVRGTVEKVYGLVTESMQAINEEAVHASREDHKRYFFTYMIGLMDDLEHYFQAGSVDMIKDGLSYRRGKYYMTDEEYSAFIGDLANTFGKVIKNGPAPGRKARTIGLVMIPDKDV
jgi:DNA-binding transcriptional ArsR family regulator